MTTPEVIRSRDNPLFKRLRALALDNSAYRKDGCVWLEGEHLCSALLSRGLMPQRVLRAESAPEALQRLRLPAGVPVSVLADALMKDLGTLESPAPLGMLWPLPPRPALQPEQASVVLDRVQDPGNVGSILRSAAAFGYRQVLALRGTAALWSAKVVRAGMGAHFSLSLIELASEADVEALRVPLLATSSHAGQALHEATLPWPCAWVLGHEGQGVEPALIARAAAQVRIAQPGGEESLNVAAAAAICLHQAALSPLRAP